MGDSPDPAIDQQGPTRAADTTSRPSQLIERAETAERIAIEGGRSRFPPRPVLPVGRPRLGARPSSGVRLRYGRLAPVGAARRGAAPLLLVSSSYRYRCAVLATRPSRQLHSALVAQPRRQRCAARCCVISPLLDGVPSAPSRRRLHAPLVTSPSREQFVLRDADRGCTHVLVWRTGSHMPNSPYRELPVARRFRGRGSAARASWQVAARRLVLIARVVGRRPLPGARSILVSYAVRGSFRCGSGVLVRRCAAWALRAGAARAVRCPSRRIGHAWRDRDGRGAETVRAADRARAKPVAKHGVRALPAGSDDLTKHAGSTAPTRRSHRGYTGRYKCEAIRLDAPRFPRRSRIVDTARAGRGGRGCDLRVCSRSAMVQNVRRTVRPARRRFRGVCGRSFAYVRA